MGLRRQLLSTSSEERGFLRPLGLCAQRGSPIGWCSLGQGYFLVFAPTRPPSALSAGAPGGSSPPEGKRPWTGRQVLDYRVQLELEAGCCERSEASPSPPVPFPGTISPGAFVSVVPLAWRASLRRKWLPSLERSSSPGLDHCTAASWLRPAPCGPLPVTSPPLWGDAVQWVSPLLHLLVWEGGVGFTLTPDRCVNSRWSATHSASCLPRCKELQTRSCPSACTPLL